MIVLAAGAALGPAQAAAAELSDYLWQRRPLLVFAPTASDPRLGETCAMNTKGGFRSPETASDLRRADRI
jgi:hypothetical protein